MQLLLAWIDSLSMLGAVLTAGESVGAGEVEERNEYRVTFLDTDSDLGSNPAPPQRLSLHVLI